MRRRPATADFVASSLATAARGAPADPPARLELDRFLPYQLNVLAATTSLGLSQIYARRHGISIPEWRVIATLGARGELTAREIGRETHMHKTKVSRAVAGLERRGLVIRRTRLEDRREALLALTQAGADVYRDLVPLALAYADALTHSLSARERRQLDHLITRLLASARELAHGSGLIPSEED